MNEIESGMNFEDFFFKLDQSSVYFSLGEGYKMVDYIGIKNKVCYLIEAKTTFPNPETNGGINFDEEIKQIYEKMYWGLLLYFGIVFKRQYKVQFKIPVELTKIPSNIILILIIKSH